jgi:hypothetical protein
LLLTGGPPVFRRYRDRPASCHFEQNGQWGESVL